MEWLQGVFGVASSTSDDQCDDHRDGRPGPSPLVEDAEFTKSSDKTVLLNVVRQLQQAYRESPNPSTLAQAENQVAALTERNSQLVEQCSTAGMCVVCYDARANMCPAGCMHLCICSDCFHFLDSCPICRNQSEYYLRVFLS